MRWPWRKAVPVIQGIDVSNYQGRIDWPTVAASGVQFAIVHYVDGLAIDPWAETNWRGAKAAGLVRGVYVYVYPQSYAWQTMTEFAVATLRPVLEPYDFVMLDLEEGSGDQSAGCLSCLQGLEAGLGPKPLLYSRLNLLEEYGIAANAEIAQYGLAIASWGVTAPVLPPAWPFWAIWQYSAHGTIPGISGNVDLDQFNGTVEQLRAYGLQPRPAPPAMTNDDVVQVERFLLAQPPDPAGARGYLARFVP